MGREYAICAIDQITEVHPGLGHDIIVGGMGDDQIVIEEASSGLLQIVDRTRLVKPLETRIVKAFRER
jgi:hypothetical protein